MAKVSILAFLTVLFLASSSHQAHDDRSEESRFVLNVSSNYTLKVRPKRNVIIVNDLADPLIDEFRRKMLSQGENVIPVDDVTEAATFRFLGKTMTYMRFFGRNGTIRDLATVYRIGDVTLRHDDRRGLTINLHFGLKLLKYKCDSYLLKLPLFGFSGYMEVEVPDNEIVFDATVVNENQICKFYLNSLKVLKLQGTRVKLTGFSILNRLMNRVVAWVLRSFEETIVRKAEAELVDGFVKAIERAGRCRREQQPGQ